MIEPIPSKYVALTLVLVNFAAQPIVAKSLEGVSPAWLRVLIQIVVVPVGLSVLLLKTNRRLEQAKSVRHEEYKPRRQDL